MLGKPAEDEADEEDENDDDVEEEQGDGDGDTNERQPSSIFSFSHKYLGLKIRWKTICNGLFSMFNHFHPKMNNALKTGHLSLEAATNSSKRNLPGTKRKRSVKSRRGGSLR